MVYQHSSKPLDAFLAREERQVYMAIGGQSLSLEQLVQVTGLEAQLVERSLQHLQSLGLVVSQEPVPSNPQGALEVAKQRLLQTVDQLLGQRASKYRSELEQAQSLEQLEGAATKLAIKLRLTVSVDIASRLDQAIKQFFAS